MRKNLFIYLIIIIIIIIIIFIIIIIREFWVNIFRSVLGRQKYYSQHRKRKL